MKPALIFAAGFAAGALALLWLIGRTMSTPTRPWSAYVEQEWRVPVDPYVDGLPW